MSSGRLLVCATPIGNLGDVSERLRNTLASADVIYAEDTRRTAKLLTHLNLSITLLSLFAGNEKSRTESIVRAVEAGQSVVVVSDAGMPTLSDPGAEAVRAVREAGYVVSVVPGPSAVSTAVALSGFGGDRYVFEGFLPRKGRDRAERLAQLSAELRPVVLFVSPKRLRHDLEDLAEACGREREVAVMRELTKLHEESWVGSLGGAVERWSGEVKGELTVVLGPGVEREPDFEAAVENALRLMGEGVSLSDAARSVAAESGVSRTQLYTALLASQESS